MYSDNEEQGYIGDDENVKQLLKQRATRNMKEKTLGMKRAEQARRQARLLRKRTSPFKSIGKTNPIEKTQTQRVKKPANTEKKSKKLDKKLKEYFQYKRSFSHTYQKLLVKAGLLDPKGKTNKEETRDKALETYRLMNIGSTMAAQRFQELSAQLQEGHNRNTSPESVRNQFMLALPGLKERIARLDNDVKTLAENSALLDCNLRFLERKCVDLERQNDYYLLTTIAKLLADRTRNRKMATLFKGVLRQLNEIQEERAFDAASSRRETAINLETMTETLALQKTEITVQSTKCDEMYVESRNELDSVTNKKRKQIQDFQEELKNGRNAYEAYKRNDIFKMLPSQFIPLTLEEFANDQTEALIVNCGVMIKSSHNVQNSIRLALDRWNMQIISIFREESEDILAKIEECDGARQFWQYTALNIRRICDNLVSGTI